MVLERFRLGTAWHRVCNERRYDAPADPWRRVWVDPAEVERLLAAGAAKAREQAAGVLDRAYDAMGFLRP